MLPHLNRTRDRNEFFSKLSKGKLFEFNRADFKVGEVKAIAKEFGFNVTLCISGSTAYRQYGNSVFRVESKVPLNERVIEPVDQDDVAADFTKPWKKVTKKRVSEIIGKR